MSLLTDILTLFGPIILFFVAMIIIYFRGIKINNRIYSELKEEIETSLKQYTTKVEITQIKPETYEIYCHAKNKNIAVLTLVLQLVNRTFIIQWLINLLFKEKEKLFIGAKIHNEGSIDNPAYKFEVVPYRKKMFIRQRFEKFVELDDIPTINLEIDKQYMIKSESRNHVIQFVEEQEIINLLEKLEPSLEYISIRKSAEDTDPHISINSEFRTDIGKIPIADLIKLFFIIAELHIDNHERIKRLIVQGQKNKGYSSKRGIAKRGAGKTNIKKTKK
ncbi:MAG: DUF1682 domain-containing protein [Candidatus Heimdallarchaeota archaeon]|nr:DUF1682 domain-containing protein [Candidatus Heimdallarchaeota archaeon]MDH5645901.1 DUF1682 domain-containing protein [Candidatus Heimdallarchaeota archaeon]